MNRTPPLAPPSAAPSASGGLAALFHRVARRTSEFTGSALAFALALGTVVVWLLSGPVFHYSDTWQLVINTGTTVVTFLMVFLIQNQQNRDSKVLQLKLDELLHAVRGARDSLIDLENGTDEDLARLEREFRDLSRHVRAARSPDGEECL